MKIKKSMHDEIKLPQVDKQSCSLNRRKRKSVLDDSSTSSSLHSRRVNTSLSSTPSLNPTNGMYYLS